MANITEFVEDGKLQCGGVNHPKDLSRDTMFFLAAQGGMLCFGCRVCTEVTQRPQLHILTDTPEHRRIYQQTRKAQHIERDIHGKILSFY